MAGLFNQNTVRFYSFKQRKKYIGKIKKKLLFHANKLWKSFKISQQLSRVLHKQESYYFQHASGVVGYQLLDFKK